MLPKLHAALTGLLLVAAVSFAALWYKGRATPGAAPPGGEEKPAQADAGGRYSIELDEGARFLLDGAGPQGFFGANVLEAWAFKYTGGYLQVSLETDIDGAARSGDVLPADWPSLLSRDDGVRQDRAAAFRKQGYVVLTAMPSVVTVDDALHQYRVQLGGAFAAGHLGPLYTLAPLLQEVTHLRPYRLFLAASPAPKMTGAGFNLWAEHVLPIREPLVPRRLADEEYHVGGGKNLQAGKDFTLLDRARGHSRVRLKARFLGDGEVRELAGKASEGEKPARP